MDITWHITGNYKAGWKVVAENRHVRVEVEGRDLHRAVKEAEGKIVSETRAITRKTFVTHQPELHMPLDRHNHD